MIALCLDESWNRQEESFYDIKQICSFKSVQANFSLFWHVGCLVDRIFALFFKIKFKKAQKNVQSDRRSKGGEFKF